MATTPPPVAKPAAVPASKAKKEPDFKLGKADEPQVLGGGSAPVVPTDAEVKEAIKKESGGVESQKKAVKK